MKRLTIALFLMSCASMMQAQTLTQVVSQGADITFTSGTLQVVNSSITAVLINGIQTTANLGTVSLNTAPLISGDLQTGATFGAGGTFLSLLLATLITQERSLLQCGQCLCGLMAVSLTICQAHSVLLRVLPISFAQLSICQSALHLVVPRLWIIARSEAHCLR